MAAGKTTGKNPPSAGKTTKMLVDQQVVELAEQLGWFLGTARAKADGWLESDRVRKELARIRDGATELLQHIDAASRSAQMTVVKAVTAKPAASAKPVATAKPAATAKPVAAAKPVATPKPVATAKTAAETALRPSRGLVDAPGKRHRQPPPNVKLDKRMGEPVGKQMGQKSFQVGKSRGRG